LFGLLMNVIPCVGPFIAVAPALIVGAFQDPMMIIWVSLVMLVVQQIESNLISPNVMGRALSLHPLTVIPVILAAGSIAGFIGILCVVPFYAVVKTIIVHFYEKYRRSIFGDEYLISDMRIIMNAKELERLLLEVKSDYIRIQGDMDKLEYVKGRVSSAEEQLIRLEGEIAEVNAKLDALDEE